MNNTKKEKTKINESLFIEGIKERGQSHRFSILLISAFEGYLFNIIWKPELINNPEAIINDTYLLCTASVAVVLLFFLMMFIRKEIENSKKIIEKLNL